MGALMKRKLISLISLSVITALSFTNSVNAGPVSYDCVINKVQGLDSEGDLQDSFFGSDLLGEHFAVSRADGTIIGPGLTTVLATQTIVINAGVGGNSFKSIALFDGQAQIIEIQEWREGTEKPFIAMSMGGAGLVTGLCE